MPSRIPWTRRSSSSSSCCSRAPSPCSSGGDDPPPPPEGWRSFDDSGYSGYVRNEWTHTLVPRDKFLEFAATRLQKEGLTALRDEVIAQSRGVDPETAVEESVLLVITDDPYAEINVQGCYPGLNTNDATLLMKELKRLGFESEQAGEARASGHTISVIKSAVVSGVDSYQAIVGGGSCYSIVTLSVPTGEGPLVQQWMTFLQYLAVEDE